MTAIHLPLIFQNGMVLQRRKPICIWGSATQCDHLTVELADAQVLCAVRNGLWQAYLPPMEAGVGYTLTVSTQACSVSVTDVAIGEVWLASGQSNMEFLLRDEQHVGEALGVSHPDIRCFEVPKISYAGQENDRDYSQVGCWRKACGTDSLFFTAVGYYFARQVKDTLGVPVGIVNCTWGGTSACVFTAEEYLTGLLRAFLDEAEAARKKLNASSLEKFKETQCWLDQNPFDNSVPNLVPISPNEEMMAFRAEMDTCRLAPFSPFRPCGLYETMLKTVIPYTLSGVIWYQGESDAPYQERYAALMKAMITCWRDAWHEELPFLMVQLASFEEMTEPLDFVPIRAVQERLTKTMNRVWMICAMDAGMRYDIHPKDKRTIGQRLALQALSKVYGYPILADSPTAAGCRRHGSRVEITLDHCGDGLRCAGERPQTFDVTADGEAVDFEITLYERSIALTSPVFAHASSISVRFAWRPYCADNLYNSAGLPVLPFQYDI